MRVYKYIKEYKNYVKDFQLEEPLDYLIFRPLAYVLVILTYKLPLTPNHFSLFGFISSVAAGYYLSLGTKDSFFLAGIGILLFMIFDCCDGMIARMKKNSSKYGEFIDMFVDVVANIFVYLGLYMGLRINEEYHELRNYALYSGVTILIHASIYNFYKKQYFFYVQNKPSGRIEEFEKYRDDLEALRNKRGHYFSKLLLKSFLLFSKIQKNPDKINFYPSDKYVLYNKKTLSVWSLISGSSHLFLLALFLILNSINYYFFMTLIIFNIWPIIAYIYQIKINSYIRKEFT